MRLLKSVAFATAIALAGLTIPVAARAEHTGDDIQPEVVSGFQACHNSHDMKPAKETSLGSELGEGISEVVTEELREMVNQGLSSAGKNALPEETAALRYLLDGRILAVDAAGNQTAEVSSTSSDESVLNPDASKEPSMLPADLWDEVKRIVGACLGFGGAGGMGFEKLVRWLGNPMNAAKFVIRRIGLVGAVSCIGGIIWSYI